MKVYFHALISNFHVIRKGVKIFRGRDNDPDSRPFEPNHFGLTDPNPRIQEAISDLHGKGGTYSHDGVNWIVEWLRDRPQRAKILAAASAGMGAAAVIVLWVLVAIVKWVIL